MFTPPGVNCVYGVTNRFKCRLKSVGGSGRLGQPLHAFNQVSVKANHFTLPKVTFCVGIEFASGCNPLGRSIPYRTYRLPSLVPQIKGR
jgi:hypothetical protein